MTKIKFKNKLNITGVQLSLISKTHELFWTRLRNNNPSLYQQIIFNVEKTLYIQKDYLLDIHNKIKNELEKNRREKVSVSIKNKKIKNLETGEIYSSVTEAMQKLKTNHPQLKKWINNYNFYYKKHLENKRIRKPVKIVFI